MLPRIRNWRGFICFSVHPPAPTQKKPHAVISKRKSRMFTLFTSASAVKA